MSLSRPDSTPPEPARASTDFGPHQYDNGARRIEQGISAGMGTQALHEELSLMREAAMHNGNFNLAQYRADVNAIDKKLHADGFLPHVHIDVDGQGHDVIKKGGDQVEAGQPTERHHGGARSHHGRRHGHGHGRGHSRGHGRGRAAAPEQSQEGAPETVAPAESLQEQDMRPDNGPRTRPGADVAPDRAPAGDLNTDPGKDRSRKSGDLQLWGQPTISAAGIDKVLRDNHSPAAGLGSYIYDQATAHGINPAFALAMYGQESTFGTKGAAVRNNSFGNIRRGAHGYQPYESIKDGIDHFMQLMSSDAYHGKSLQALVHKYAPASDGNNQRNYISYVTNSMSKWARMNDGAPDLSSRGYG